jgi:hypothetical protein
MSRRPLTLGLVTTSILTLAVLAAALAPPRPGAAQADAPPAAVGLSLFFENGRMAPITLVGDAPRYLQEVDLAVTTPTTPTDLGLAPLTQDSELASLDWSGVHLADEDWRPDVDGTWILQRFYRGAHWMEQPGHFAATPLDAAGPASRPAGDPLIAQAGSDDRWRPGDDGFVRRFVVRQVIRHCAGLHDLSGANSFTLQGLVQFRDALNADQRARTIPPTARSLRLFWSADPHAERSVDLAHAEPSAYPFGYGFQPGLELVNLPARGYYLPGEAVSFRVTFRDGQGNRLHPPGSLPTYGQFVRGEIASGLRYYDGFRLFPTTYYAFKHRESNLLLTLSGPTDRLKTPTRPISLFEFLGPQVVVTTPPQDGFTDLASAVPPGPLLFGGLFDPSIWDLPVSDVFDLTLPADSLPGTYVAAIKARREWGGEALNRTFTMDVPVGPAATAFVAKTGNCSSCHTGPTAFAKVLHGVSDRRACFSCHAPIIGEPDGSLDIRVHMVHSRSERFRSVGGNIQNCGMCHLTPPPGPLRNSGEDGL